MSERFQSPERNVSKEDDGYYYLRSLNFDSSTDDNAVCECALELLEHMNGAAKFYSGESYRTVEFDGINQTDDKGKRHHFVYLSRTTEGRSKVPASFMVTREGDVAKPSQTPNEAESLVDLAEQDERVANTLRFFQKGDWINLYKAWEIVARDVAGGAHDVVKTVGLRGMTKIASRERRRVARNWATKHVMLARIISPRRNP